MPLPISIVSNPGGTQTAPGPVVDAKTGTIYPTLAAGLAGSVATILGPFPVAVANRGQVTPAGLPVQPDDFYKGQYLVVTGITPSFPNVVKSVLIVAYDSAGGILYLEDDTLLIAGQDEVTIVDRPELDIYENVSGEGVLPIAGPVRLNFQGNVGNGFDFNDAAMFVEILNAQLDNGIVINEGTCLKARNSVIAPRASVGTPSTGLAIESLSGSRGRIELYHCEIGEVAISKERSHFDAVSCVPSCRGNGRVGLPVTLAHVAAGAALKIFQYSCNIDSMFAGAFFNIEDGGSIDFTNTPQLLINADIDQPPTSQDLSTFNPYADTSTYFLRMSGSANVVGVSTFAEASEIYIHIETQTVSFAPADTFDHNNPAAFAWINVVDYSGACSFGSAVNGVTAVVTVGGYGAVAHILISGGGANMTGAVVADTGISVSYSGQTMGFYRVLYSGNMSGGSVTLNEELTVAGDNAFAVAHAILVPQDNIVFTMNATFNMQGPMGWLYEYDFAIGNTVTTATVNENGDIFFMGTQATFIYSLFGEISGGTWNVTGATNISKDRVDANESYVIALNAGAAGTVLDVSGRVFTQNIFCEGIVVGITFDATVIVSGTVFVQNFTTTGDVTAVAVFGGAGVGTVSGGLALEHGRIGGNFATINNFSGVPATGPIATRMDHITAVGASWSYSPTGVFVAVGSDDQIRNCHIENEVILDGTNQTTFNAYNSFFAGTFTVGVNSITVANANVPGAFLWHCQHYSTIGASGGVPFPLVTELRDIIVVHAAVPLLLFELATIAAPGVAVPCIAGSVIEGVTPFGYAPGDEAILARDFSMPVHSDPAVLAGDNLILNPGAPTTAITGAIVVGKEVGRAMEASATATFGLNFPYVHGRVR